MIVLLAYPRRQFLTNASIVTIVFDDCLRPFQHIATAGFFDFMRYEDQGGVRPLPLVISKPWFLGLQISGPRDGRTGHVGKHSILRYGLTAFRNIWKPYWILGFAAFEAKGP